MAAIDHLNATHPGTRVFAIPGNDFAAYRWGDTVDTPQPAFLDRDFITREQQILGSIATADTLYAIDGPLQDGTANMNALAPMARLMGAGDLMVEYDQQYERYGVPSRSCWPSQLLQTPLGLTDPKSLRHPASQHLGGVDPQRGGPVRPRQRAAGPPPSSPTPCRTRGRSYAVSPTPAPSSWRVTPPA